MSEVRLIAEVLVLGSELVQGRRNDENGPFLAIELTRLGFNVGRICLAPDDPDVIERELLLSIERGVDLVIVCGGLGPTRDDVTKEVVAKALELILERDEKALSYLRARMSSLHHGQSGSAPKLTEESLQKQALGFRSGRWFENRVGLAPGLSVGSGSTEVYLLPGPPRELKDVFKWEIIPDIRNRFAAVSHPVRLFRTAGLREIELFSVVDPLIEFNAGIDVSYFASPGVVDVVLSSKPGGESLLATKASRVREVLGPSVYAEEERELQELIGDELERRCEFLATAESCTAGWVSQLITEVPGSSGYFLGGIVAYQDRVKRQLLSVPEEDLELYGAVSYEVAKAMALGVKEKLGSNWALSVTGIAGPEGGSREKPVGLVYHGLAFPHGQVRVFKYHLSGDREVIRLAGARLALDLLRRGLQGKISSED